MINKAIGSIFLLFQLTNIFAQTPFSNKNISWNSLLQSRDDYEKYWEVFIGVPHATVKGLELVDPESDGKKGIPLGLGNDPKKVFNLKKIGEEWVLHITGEIYGALTTRKEFENYHLSLQFKWGEKVWAPRLERPRDSGILYHCQGEHGAFWNVWMKSLEFQVQEGDLGDFYALAGTEVEIPSHKPQGQKEYDYLESGETIVFSSIRKNYSVHCNKGLNNENARGEWNTLDLICIGDQSYHLVNGKIVLVTQNCRYLDDNGQELSLNKGKIQIQSEGAEVYYKNIRIKSLDGQTSIAKYLSRL